MFPVMATGASNPEPGRMDAVTSVTASADSVADGAVTEFPLPPGADVLARHILDAVLRCRELGHRDPSITLTRPTAIAEAVVRLLTLAGLHPSLRASSIAGQSVMMLRP